MSSKPLLPCKHLNYSLFRLEQTTVVQKSFSAAFRHKNFRCACLGTKASTVRHQYEINYNQCKKTDNQIQYSR